MGMKGGDANVAVVADTEHGTISEPGLSIPDQSQSPFQVRTEQSTVYHLTSNIN